MDPITVLAAIATIVLQKALEKTSEELGERVLKQSDKLLSTLKTKSPKAASAIELSLEQPLDYGQVVADLETLIEAEPEVAEIVQELAIAGKQDSNMSLSESSLMELANSLKEQSLESKRDIYLADKIGLVVQGSSNTIANINLGNALFHFSGHGISSPQWSRKEKYEKYQFQWEIFIKFSGNNIQASKAFQLLFWLTEALGSISGVSVEIESQGVGSIWFKLRVFIKNFIQKDEVKEVLEKTRDAVIAEQLDKRIVETEKLEEETLKTKAERIAAEKQNTNLPSAEEVQKIRDIEIHLRELEVREKEADIERKEIENQQKKLELYEQVAYMMEEGLLTAAAVEIQINGVPFISSEDKKILPGVDMDTIDNRGARNPNNETES